MIAGLDFRAFGNGHGLSVPMFDRPFFWLGGDGGAFYTRSGYYGCQLASFQWTHPLPGERRHILMREFEVFRSERKGLRVRVSWRMVGLDGLNAEQQRSMVEDLKNDLRRLV